MTTTMRRAAGSLALAVVVLATSAGQTFAQQPPPAGAQAGGPPPPPQNLQVLPKDISRQDLTAVMRGFTEALGVQCVHCHVAEPQRDLACDAKPAKKTARVMLQMTMRVNETLAGALGKPASDVVKVQCATCHRGKPIPELPPPAPTPAAQQAPR